MLLVSRRTATLDRMLLFSLLCAGCAFLWGFIMSVWYFPPPSCSVSKLFSYLCPCYSRQCASTLFSVFRVFATLCCSVCFQLPVCVQHCAALFRLSFTSDRRVCFPHWHCISCVESSSSMSFAVCFSSLQKLTYVLLLVMFSVSFRPPCQCCWLAGTSSERARYRRGRDRERKRRGEDRKKHRGSERAMKRRTKRLECKQTQKHRHRQKHKM